VIKAKRLELGHTDLVRADRISAADLTAVPKLHSSRRALVSIRFADRGAHQEFVRGVEDGEAQAGGRSGDASRFCEILTAVTDCVACRIGGSHFSNGSVCSQLSQCPFGRTVNAGVWIIRAAFGEVGGHASCLFWRQQLGLREFTRSNGERSLT
jgi:hypothetical protein